MRASVFFLAAASVAVASAEVIELFGAGVDGILVYSIDSDATATTYLMGCPVKSATEENCLFMNPVQYTAGPSTVQMVTTREDLTITQSCTFEGKTRAACSVSAEGPGTTYLTGGDDHYESVYRFTGTAAEELWGPATVVTDATSIYNADSASLVPVTTSTGGSIAPSTIGPGVTSAPTITPTGTTGTDSEATGTDSTAVETSESTGGMPQITGSCGWAVGGVAAAIALAAL